MAITPTGISWLDQWILSQGGTLAGQDTDVPPVASPQPTYESSRRFLKRYISGDSAGSDDYDSNLTGGYAPDIGIGESFQSLITSAAGLFDKFDVGSIVDVEKGSKGLFSGGLEGLVEAAKTDFNNFISTTFDPLNNYTTYNQGPWGNAIRAFQDPSVGPGRKFGAAMIPLGSTFIPGANLFGALASALNSMGAFHEWDPDQDSNLAFNPATSKFEWDSEAPGGGGIQWGPESARNMAEDITKNHPDEWVTIQNEEGDEMGKIQGKDLFNWVDQTMGVLGPDGRMSMSAYQDPFALGYMDDMFGTGPSMSLDFPGMTNSEALGSLSNMTGNAFNSVMADAYAQGLGYNEGIAAAQQAADEMAGDWSTGPYGGTIGGMSLDAAFDAAMQEAGPTGTVDSGSEGGSDGNDGSFDGGVGDGGSYDGGGWDGGGWW